MSMTFTKLFSSITESTVWCEPDRVRLVWITMLAMADHRGRVWASVPGLANRARVPVEDAKAAIDRFLAPDEYSRTPDNDGRRIEPIDGGWRLLNYEKYRAIRDAESVKEAKRRYINAKREAERQAAGVENVDRVASTVDRCRVNAEAEAEAEAEKNKKKRKPQRAAATVSRPESVSEQVWADWLSLRKSKRAPVTETVIESAIAEAGKAGMPVEDFLRVWCARGSQGLQAEWLKPHERIRSVDQSERERMFRRAL